MEIPLTIVEENYMKAIFKLSAKEEAVSTNDIAAELSTSAASVSDMVKKLATKDLVIHQKYYGVQLTEAGKRLATLLVRSHRLWEVFLVNKLGFSWDQIHEIAEQLEHIKSPLLMERLEAFLDNPTHDPHGEPIPDAQGNFRAVKSVTLSEMQTGEKGVVVSAEDQHPSFLQYLDRVGVAIGTHLTIKEWNPFDASFIVVKHGGGEVYFSEKAAQSLKLRKE